MDFNDQKINELMSDSRMTPEHINLLLEDPGITMSDQARASLQNKVTQPKEVLPNEVTDNSQAFDAPLAFRRFMAKNFAANPKQAINYLKEAMPEKDWALVDTALGKEVVYKTRGSSEKWASLDPLSPEFQDVSDSLFDTISGAAQATAMVPGAAFGGLAGAAGAAGATSAGMEAIRQTAGKLLGVNKEYDPGAIEAAGLSGASVPVVGATIGQGARLGKYLAKLASDFALDMGSGATEHILTNKEKFLKLLGNPSAQHAERQAIVEGIKAPAQEELNTAISNARAFDKTNPAMMKASDLSDLITEGSGVAEKVAKDIAETGGRVKPETQALVDAWKSLHNDVLNKKYNIPMSSGLVSSPESKAMNDLKLQWDELEYIRKSLDAPVKYDQGNALVSSVTKAPLDEKAVRSTAKNMADKLRAFLDQNPIRRNLYDTLEQVTEKVDPYTKFDPNSLAAMSKIRNMSLPSQVPFKQKFESDYPQAAENIFDRIATLNAATGFDEGFSASPYSIAGAKEAVAKTVGRPIFKGYVKTISSKPFEVMSKVPGAIEDAAASGLSKVGIETTPGGRQAAYDLWKKILKAQAGAKAGEMATQEDMLP